LYSGFGSWSAFSLPLIWLDFLWICILLTQTSPVLIGSSVLFDQERRKRFSSGYWTTVAASVGTQVLTLSFNLHWISTCFFCFLTLFRRMYFPKESPLKFIYYIRI
jgi:hypothetical protein